MKASEVEFLEKINKHKGILYKLSRVYFADDEDRNDLMQEMISNLWQNYSSFRNESEYSTYMYRVCLNTAILFFKKEKRRQKAHMDFHLENEKFEELEMSSDDEKIKALHYSFQYLDTIEKAIIFQYLEGMDNKTIAKNLGISEGNLRVKLHRTKEKIKSIITKKFTL